MATSSRKMQQIKEVVEQKRAWCEAYDQYPYSYWKRKWDFLCRQLNELSDMQRSLRYGQKAEFSGGQQPSDG
jgi:hypothetical protein